MVWELVSLKRVMIANCFKNILSFNSKRAYGDSFLVGKVQPVRLWPAGERSDRSKATGNTHKESQLGFRRKLLKLTYSLGTEYKPVPKILVRMPFPVLLS